MQLTPNPTNDRLKFILKTYGQKKPAVVLDMIDVIARTVGVDDWAARIDTPEGRKADAEFFEDLERWYHARRTAHPAISTPALATATVMLVNELPQFKTRHRADPLFPWMATQLARLYESSLRGVERQLAQTRTTGPVGADLYALGSADYRITLGEMRAMGTMLAQWYEARRPNLGDYDWKTARDEAKTWETEEGPVPQGEVAVELSDGWTAQELTTKEQLDVEGEKMQHCVGSYAREVEAEETSIYSLRDPKGQPHVTIEVKNGRIKQIQGKQNRTPDKKYEKYVDEFKAWGEENNISPTNVAPHLQAYADAIAEHTNDWEEEYLEDYAREWNENTANAEEAAEWMKMGLSYSEAELAGSLGSEDVTPEEYGQFPWAVVSMIVSQGGVPRELEAMVSIARMTNKLVELLPQRDPPPPPSKQDPQGLVSLKSRWNQEAKPHLGYKSIAFGEWEDARHNDDEKSEWLYPAEEWLGHEFSPDPDKDEYVGPWFIHRFTPEQADAWWDAGIEDGNVAAELRDRRVTPKMVEELEDAEGYHTQPVIKTSTLGWRDENDHVWDMTARQIIDVLDEKGIHRNPDKRTSKRPVSRPRR